MSWAESAGRGKPGKCVRERVIAYRGINESGTAVTAASCTQVREAFFCKGVVLLKAYIDFWRRYADFSGRTTRYNYWMSLLMHSILILLFVVLLPIVLVAGLKIGTEIALQIFNIFYTAVSLASITPGFAITVRRLRDAGFSAKSLFWLLIPGFGIVALFVRLCTKSAE